MGEADEVESEECSAQRDSPYVQRGQAIVHSMRRHHQAARLQHLRQAGRDEPHRRRRSRSRAGAAIAGGEDRSGEAEGGSCGSLFAALGWVWLFGNPAWRIRPLATAARPFAGTRAGIRLTQKGGLMTDTRFLVTHPMLPSLDLDRTIQFYREHWGFSPWKPNEDVVVLTREQV